jgi:hypothetical protein
MSIPLVCRKNKPAYSGGSSLFLSALLNAPVVQAPAKQPYTGWHAAKKERPQQQQVFDVADQAISSRGLCAADPDQPVAHTMPRAPAAVIPPQLSRSRKPHIQGKLLPAKSQQEVHGLYSAHTQRHDLLPRKRCNQHQHQQAPHAAPLQHQQPLQADHESASIQSRSTQVKRRRVCPVKEFLGSAPKARPWSDWEIEAGLVKHVKQQEVCNYYADCTSSMVSPAA